MVRNIYKSYGEIVSKENITNDIEYDRDKVIIDKISINCNDYEECNYYQEKNILNMIENEKEKWYITRIYIKNDKEKEYADKLFTLLQ